MLKARNVFFYTRRKFSKSFIIYLLFCRRRRRRRHTHTIRRCGVLLIYVRVWAFIYIILYDIHHCAYISDIVRSHITHTHTHTYIYITAMNHRNNIRVRAFTWEAFEECIYIRTRLELITASARCYFILYY